MENDAKKIFDFYNYEMSKANAAIPHHCRYTKRRKQAILARCREHGEEAMYEMIEKAARSDFLNGRGKTPWVANLDWLLRPNNFVKVIEGNYDNNRFFKQPDKYANQQPKIDPRRGTDPAGITPEEYDEDF